MIVNEEGHKIIRSTGWPKQKIVSLIVWLKNSPSVAFHAVFNSSQSVSTVNILPYNSLHCSCVGMC